MKLGIREIIQNKIQLLWLFDIIILSVYFFIISITTNLNGCVLGLNESQSKAFNLFLFGCLIFINLWIIFIRNTKNRIAKLILDIFFIFTIANVSIMSIRLYKNKAIEEIITCERLNYFSYVFNSCSNKENIYVLISSNLNNNLNFVLISNIYRVLSKEEMEKYNTKVLFRDGWGTPFNVDYATNIVKNGKIFSNVESLTKREEFRIKAIDQLNRSPIIVWSSGPNRKDERCLGDDIVWPLLDEEGASRHFLLEQEWGAKVKN